MRVANAIIARGLAWTDLGTADPRDCLAAEQQWLERAEPRLGVWESDRECVVLGVAGQVKRDVRASANVPVLRRHSGGGAVLLGAGCLNYSLVIPFALVPACRDVGQSWTSIFDGLLRALAIEGLRREPPCDLALGGRKVSGNAQRRTRDAVLHHGTFLYNFRAARVDEVLALPARQPPYRAGRAHADFLGNLPLSSQELRARLRALAG